MGLVNQVGRRRFRARFAMLALYGILTLGALTTLYPFAMMMVTGFKGPTDQNDNSLVPRFWSEVDSKDPKTGKLAPESLMGKYLADKYAGDASMIESTRIGADATPEQVAAYEKTLMQLPLSGFYAGFRTAPTQSTSRLAMRYQNWLRGKFATIDDLNKAYYEENPAFETVQAPVELLERRAWQPPKSRKYEDWLTFKAELPAEFRVPLRINRLWQEFMRSQCENQFDRVPEFYKKSATKFEELKIVRSGDVFRRFIGALPARPLMDISGTEGDYPIAAFETSFVKTHEAEIKREFTTRNYRYVGNYMALNGRALINTAIFCALAILTQLIVNPLAAFALSRFPMKSTGRILLFLLATMAFPAEVAMIPSFLLLKQLGLLNTFAALVLPTAASGYMIFLLKGFFDSLPPELFESGQIDGAKESTLMFKIAFPMSRPVLGYLALIAFMGAYGAFLYAFLVAQDQKIWTIMVFIYQLQNTAPKAVMMAALTLAALPTLLVFLVAQRAIMRGIIVPGEK
ncbi:MAG: carbohydrate ABC transporter permease [Fimbriimonadaceae bacterium]